jgi:hypothetical protein
MFYVSYLLKPFFICTLFQQQKNNPTSIRHFFLNLLSVYE